MGERVAVSEGLVRYRLAAACPKCLRRPTSQIFPSVVAWAMTMPPEEPFMTVLCTRHRCNAVYWVAFVALQYAELVSGDSPDIPRAA